MEACESRSCYAETKSCVGCVRRSEPMSIKINSRESNGATILDLKGALTLGGGDEQLNTAIHHLVDAGKVKMLVNLKGVKDVDSSGIGELVGCFTTVSKRGGKLKLACL